MPHLEAPAQEGRHLHCQPGCQGTTAIGAARVGPGVCGAALSSCASAQRRSVQSEVAEHVLRRPVWA